MKKSVLLLTCIFAAAFLVVSFSAKSQAWSVYNGNELPLDATPVFTASDNSPDAGFVAEVVNDPDSSANKLFKYDHAVITGKQTYKMNWDIGGESKATLVARIRGIEGTSATRVAEIDVRNVNSGVGSKLQIRYDDSVQLESPAVVAYLEKSAEWHLYRLVMDGADFSLYIDENTTPVITGTSTKARTDNWFKFGDQSDSYSHTGLFDYIIWDITGAYAPGQGAPIPDTLCKKYYGMSSNLADKQGIDCKLFPNPSSGKLTFTAPESWIDAEFIIINALGQKVSNGLITGAVTVLNTTRLTGGAYTLIIRSGDQTLHRELFIHTVL